MIGVGLQTSAGMDPSGHEPFTQIASTVTQLTVAIQGSSVIITGNGNWIPVSGNIDENGNFVASGSGTAANIPNTSAVFTGMVTRDAQGMPVGVTGTYEVGGNGSLPGGQPVSYSVAGS
jgi:hypothetical protein